MNEKIKELAEEAGFCFWGDESWKPHGAIIDWSANYDKEFQKYTELLIKECIKMVEPSSEHIEEPHYYLGGTEGIQLLDNTVDCIKKHFGLL